jgi:tetratricopeptide (TPR) repeat protein
MADNLPESLGRWIQHRRFALMGLTLTTILLLLGATARAEEDFEARFKEIEALLNAGKYKEAEPLARKCLEQTPRDLAFLSQLDMSLNGQERHAEADQLRDHILEVWEQDRKEEWLAKGSPKGEATWARFIVPSKDYVVIGTQYFTPELLGAVDEPHITSFYKIILRPRDKSHGLHIMKLEMSELVEPYYVLREQVKNGGDQLIPYGSRKPELREVVHDLLEVLEGKRELQPLASTEVQGH